MGAGIHHANPKYVHMVPTGVGHVGGEFYNVLVRPEVPATTQN